MDSFFKYNDRKLVKIMILDECFALIGVLKDFYPEIFYFICALHKLKNIKARLSENSVIFFLFNNNV